MNQFNDYLSCYRLENIFARQGFDISWATQSVWCGDVADLAEPLYELMGNEVRASHVVATDSTIMPMLRTGHCAKARMWVCVGDAAHPYNVFDFTLSRGRDGPKYFLKVYNQVLLADGSCFRFQRQNQRVQMMGIESRLDHQASAAAQPHFDHSTANLRRR